MTRQEIFSEIESERAYQENRWGNTTDDTVNSPNDWVAYIAHHSTRWFAGGFPLYPKEIVNNYRKQMIKVATLAVAAVESLDRQRASENEAFFEQRENH